MDINKRLVDLFEKLDNSDFVNKAELKAEVKCCIDAMILYFSVVSDEQLHCIEKTNNNLTSFVMLEKKRSEAHDDAINACSRLNELCREVNVDKICDFDITDRRRVAEFCGFVVSELFYSNINCKDPMASWISFENPEVSDSDVFAKVYADFVTDKFNRRFSEIKISCEDTRIESDEIFFVYKDSKGEGNTLVGDIDMSRLNEYGYISKRINETYLFLVSAYERKGFK